MSPPDSDRPVAPISPPRGSGRGALLATTVGVCAGLALVGLAMYEGRFAGQRSAAIEIRANGLDTRTGRDVLLPTHGWVLQIELPADLPPAVTESFEVTLREERTGASIEITERLERGERSATWVVPKSIGLREGLFSIRALLTGTEGRPLVAHRRFRIRSWLGGPPIGSRQIVHFDFTIDRDGEDQPDFERDLERFGMASPEAPELARAVARRVAEQALSRVVRAYDPEHDPNGTGRERDTVFVRFLLEADPSPYVTRICVGGANLDHPESIGNVRFDPHNARRGQQECEGPAAAGLFPGELTIYRESALYQEVLGPFLPAEGGLPIGAGSGDGDAIEGRTTGPRRAAIDRAIAVLGDALGTVMAHEAAHALGLVPPGRPGVGLFGGEEDSGDGYAHNLDVEGRPPVEPWLMNEGRSFGFEELAGLGAGGELRFRPLNHAYLKDRVVLVDGRPR